MKADSSPAAKSQAQAKAATGKKGEDAAAAYLIQQGCTVVARNWRAHPGEVDIVVECPGGLGSTQTVLAFVEVRTRHGRTGLAEESISPRKAASMAVAAYGYMAAHSLDPDTLDWRIDLVAVAMSGSHINSINWVQGAIDEDMLR